MANMGFKAAVLGRHLCKAHRRCCRHCTPSSLCFSLSSLPKICSNFCHLSCFFSGSKNSKSFQPRSFRLLLFFQARPTHPKQWPQPKAPQPPKPCILNPNPSSKNDVMTSQPPGLESERTAVAYCAAGGDTQAATCPHQTVIVQAGRSFRPSAVCRIKLQRFRV